MFNSFSNDMNDMNDHAKPNFENYSSLKTSPSARKHYQHIEYYNINANINT